MTETRLTPPLMVRLGGVALVGGAVAFMAVFAFLAARFNYPDVLDGPAATVLPQLLATGAAGRAAWALYALLPRSGSRRALARFSRCGARIPAPCSSRSTVPRSPPSR